MATFNLEKGSKFQINKGIQQVRVGLGWDAGNDFDLDASAFGLIHCTGNPRFYNDGSHAVCYANTGLKQNDGTFITSDESIHHLGDNRTGLGDGDDEKINIDFSKLPADIVEISIFVTIYEAGQRGQDFSMVENSYVRIVDLDTNQELCVYKLREDFAGKAAVQVGSLVKEKGIWSFQTIGAGSGAELGDILNQYS